MIANTLISDIAGWLQAGSLSEDGRYELQFDERHFGNPFVRSLHGGVTAALIELCAETEVVNHVDTGTSVTIVSNSIDYLRITRDVNLQARVAIQRISRRLAVVEVKCWQDEEDTLVAQGIVTLRIAAQEQAA